MAQDIIENRPGVATITSVSATTTSITLLAANVNRRGAFVYNDSTAILYVNFGQTASSTQFAVQVNSETLYEMPHPAFTGELRGAWDATNGSARITEWS